VYATFCIHYATSFGQRVELVPTDGDPAPLEWIGDGWWVGRAGIVPPTGYRYRVVEGDRIVDTELGPPRSFPGMPEAATVVDRWRAPDPTRLARRSALFRRARSATHPGSATPPTGSGITFRLLEPGIPPGLRPALIAGDGDPDGAVVMTPAPFPWWEATLEGGAPTGYTYALVDGGGAVIGWERGAHRTLPSIDAGTTAIVHDDELRGVPGWRGAGVAIPVFALRSPHGIGVGQFTDLAALADWAATVGISVIQLLPVNDTVLNHDWDDSYPYNPVSVEALHPLYIDLDQIAGAGIGEAIAAARAEVNDLPHVDYTRVMELKWQLLRQAYRNLEGAIDSDDDFLEFVDREWDWLGPHSMWSMLRDSHGTPDFRRWGADATFDPDRLAAMATPGGEHYDELRFHWFVQYHLHRQLTAAADHVRSRGVALKGDLPIGVAPESVEVWTAPELFHVGTQTGAPPDAFATRGQNWQFPTYDWDHMADDGYQWWQKRFRALARYVDVYRIDHVLGFFRIWEIPLVADDGLLGHFRPSLPLTAEEVRDAIGDVDVARLATPVIDAAGLEDRFGSHAAAIRPLFVAVEDGILEPVPDIATQRQILLRFEDGAFAELPETERSALQRALLDAVAEVLLVEVDGGYQPRISWENTEHYRRLSPDERVAFDTLAIDFFHHRHRGMWERQGRTTLPAIVAATDLLTCGEDLGMVPDLVPRLMNEMGLLSLEIERMPKRLGAWISDPAEAPYLSVVSPGTHDTSPLRMWWEEDERLTLRYWTEALGREGDPPATATPEVCEAVVRRQLASPAMLCIIPLADLLAIDGELRRPDAHAERINDPADRHNRWRYRLHLTIDELAAADDLNARVRDLIAASGRW